MLKQAESLPSSPDELLRYCDVELLRLRAQRKGGQGHRAAVLAVSIFVLILAGMAAFMFLFAKLQEIRPAHFESEPSVVENALPAAPYQTAP